MKETGDTLNIVMMATGEFALPSLTAIHNSRHRLIGLITQPDRVNPRGHVHPHPLKEYALAHQLPVYQPVSINTPEAIAELRSWQPDLVAVAAYGQILKADVISVPRLGMYNLHASLLPRHRGAAPVQYAIWCGDQRTGVTIFQIEPKLDAGLMIVQKSTPVDIEETAGELHDRLAIVGADAFLEAIEQIASGTAKPQSQDTGLVTLAPKIRKEQGQIDWTLSAREIDCHVRAMQPWPNPDTFLQRAGKPPERLLILKVQPIDETPQTAPPGRLIMTDDHRLLVTCGSGTLEVLIVQKAGKKPLAAADYLRGNPLQPGDRLGSDA